MFDDLMAFYEPVRLRLVIEFFPRGGIASRLVV
jgi:NADPH-dependent 7-cyano-7-deazaguanine reductase QueF